LQSATENSQSASGVLFLLTCSADGRQAAVFAVYSGSEEEEGKSIHPQAQIAGLDASLIIANEEAFLIRKKVRQEILRMADTRALPGRAGSG
jgi:hypothetical protein